MQYKNKDASNINQWMKTIIQQQKSLKFKDLILIYMEN